MNILSIIPMAFVSLMCGSLCALSHPNYSSLYRILFLQRPPVELVDYIKKHANMPAKELLATGDYSQYIEINKAWGELQTMYDKATDYERGFEHNSSLPVGYLTSIFCFCLIVIPMEFTRVSTIIFGVLYLASHAFFFIWFNHRRVGDFSWKTISWDCEFYPYDVHSVLLEANLIMSSRLRSIQETFKTSNVSKQFYLFIAAAMAVGIAITNLF